MPEDGTAPEPTPDTEPETPVNDPEPEATEPTDDPDGDIEVPEGAKNPDAVQRAIAAERKAAREANARARQFEQQLREQQERETPLEDLIAESKAKEDAANLRALRYEVAAESGIPLSLASRLQGSDRDSLAADAASLRELVSANAPAPPLPPEGGTRQTPEPPADPNTAHNQLVAALAGARAAQRAGLDPFAGLEPAPED